MEDIEMYSNDCIDKGDVAYHQNMFGISCAMSCPFIESVHHRANAWCDFP